MHSRYSLDSVQPVELVSTAVKVFREVTVHREVLLLDLEGRRFARTVVHAVCMVNRVAHVQTVRRVLTVPACCVELGGLLETGVLSMRVDALPLEGLFYDLALDQSLSLAEVLQRTHYF